MQEDNPVRPDARSRRAEIVHRLGVFQVMGQALVRSGVEKDEVVARPRHLVERMPFWDAHSRPVRCHHRRRQTMKMASRTMWPLILLSPTVRSVKTIGISRPRNPLWKARNDISIWNA